MSLYIKSDNDAIFASLKEKINVPNEPEHENGLTAKANSGNDMIVFFFNKLLAILCFVSLLLV
jgi:hypothetical protein